MSTNHSTDLSVPEGVDRSTADLFVRLAELAYATDDFNEVYRALVEAAPQLVPGCRHASLMLQREGRIETVVSSDEVAGTVDRFERELGEGPCLDAIESDSAYFEPDISTGSRWQRLAERVVAETPVRSMAGFKLLTGQSRTGALNLFADAPNGLSMDSVDKGMVLASFMSVALMAANERRTASTLREGLASNREIGKAIGLMMAFHKIDDEQAFAMLRRTSQDLNLKLVDVARQVVDHHNRA